MTPLGIFSGTVWTTFAGVALLHLSTGEGLPQPVRLPLLTPPVIISVTSWGAFLPSSLGYTPVGSFVAFR